MGKEEYIESRVGRNSPYRVPDGYFDTLADRMEAALPPYPEVPKRVDLSLWQKVRPYVYMAAMFAGIWCMMKIFHDVSSSQGTSLDSPPEAIAMAMASPEEYGIYDLEEYSGNGSDYELEAEVSEQYDSFSELQADLGITLSPEYSDL